VETDDNIPTFDAEFEPIPFNVRGADGTVSTYRVYEFADGQYAEWIKYLQKAYKDRTSPPAEEEVQAKLISMCVRNGDGNLVDETTPRVWSVKTRAFVNATCRAVNGLDALPIQRAGKV